MTRRSWFWAWLVMALAFLVMGAAAGLRAETWDYALVCTGACIYSLWGATRAR